MLDSGEILRVSEMNRNTLLQVKTLPGKSFPPGATVIDGGVNFSIFSKHATSVELLLFSPDGKLTQSITLDPDINKTYFYWHVFVPGLKHGQMYGFRVHGPFAPEEGLRFDGQKVLLDPYTKAVVGWATVNRAAACLPGDNAGCALKSVVVDTSQYDWEGDEPLGRPFAETVVYELHVGGFTRNPNSGVTKENRGTFGGIIEKIPYLKELGVTAVELLPVHEFDPVDSRSGMANYWGYSTLAFLAPHHGYCRDADAVSGINEFRDMVKQLHKAGIEVILDVVFNHTSEGDENGPTQSFRGLDNSIYYLLDQNDKSRYLNFSGCGNSFNANHPVVGRLILDSLRYLVQEMHVDGFRFDLAAALSRDVFGSPVSLPPLLWVIESDPVLAGTKLIAEAWDAAGLYSIGWFINVSNWYAEWNGPFRDDVRKFAKSDENTVSSLASRLIASPDIYFKSEREPNRSVNFVTCHDGFTLYDLVAYNTKHNELNGENNRDGTDQNYSWNCGVEGATTDEAVRKLRLQQMKNMLSILLLSQGTPMILMGDEVARTQNGNNNAYCHDSKDAWFDWDLLERNDEMFRFSKEIINLTQELEIFRQRKPVSLSPSSDKVYVEWHGTKLHQPDWSANSHSLAFTLEYAPSRERLQVLLNAYWETLEFELPPSKFGNWKRLVDTSNKSPQDFVHLPEAPVVSTDHYKAMPRSTVILRDA
jgi:isoamylase